jgi:serine/threonine-protein kinase
MSAINPSVPPELEQIVMWALNKNPVDRPANADQFITALEQAKTALLTGERTERTASLPALAGVAAGRYAAAAAVAGPAPGVQQHAPTYYDGAYEVLEPLGGPEPPPRRRRVWPWVVTLVVLLALAGAGVAAYLLTRPVKTTVPAVVNQSFTTAQTELTNDGLGVNQLQVTNAKPAGTVIRQSPLAGTRVKQGSTVSLVVSSGPGNTTVPTVVGETLQQARSSLEIANLKVGRVVHQPSNQFASGQVIDTSPSAGTTPPVGTAVTIFVSSGPAKVRVPDVTTETLGQAKAALEAPPGNFTVSTTSQVSSTATAGTVITQSPTGGSSEVPGSTITLVVAKAPPTPTVPNVVGQTRGAAEATLGSKGYPATVQPQDVTNPSQNNVVLSQSPSAGGQAAKGTNVTIVVGHYTAPTPTTTTSTPSTTTTTPAGSTTAPKKKK